MSAAWALAAVAGLLAAICVALRARGRRTIVGACLFVATLVSTQLVMRMLSQPPYNYKFPGLVTVLHFSSVAVTCALYWVGVGEPEKILPTSIGSWGRWCRTVLPIALSQPVSVVFNNKAMVYIGAGVCAVIGTLAPVATALLSRLFGRKLSVLSWVGVFVAFGGALVLSGGEAEEVSSLGQRAQTAVVTGLLFAFAAVFGRTIKIVVYDFLLSPLAYAKSEEEETEEPLSIPHAYVLTFPVGALLSLIYSLSTESVVEAWNSLTWEIAEIILCSIVSALALNFLGGYVLKELGASEQQIVGKLNTICIAVLSTTMLGEHLPQPVVIGSALVLGGVAIFEQGQRHKGFSALREEQSDEEDSNSDYESDSTQA